MTTRTRPLLAALASACAAASSVAGELSLTPAGTIDVSAANIASIGDLTVIDDRVWIADGANGGRLHAFLVSTGQLNATIDPAVIPGLTGGPDALTSVGITSLFVFSSFGQSVAGRMTTQGQLSTVYPSAHAATGADFRGDLWIASGTVAGAGTTLQRIDLSSGAILESVPVLGVTARAVDVTFDSYSGALYALFEDSILRQVDLTSGAVLFEQDLAPFLIVPGVVTGGIDFDAASTRLYVATGSGAGADTVVVLQRSLAAEACGNQQGASNCPCSNAGAPGHGCRNSLPGSHGALLVPSGVADVSADTLDLRASGMPPGTTALFFQGTTAPTTPIAFGDGVLCVNGTVIRLGTHAAPDGTAEYPAAGDLSISVRGQVPSANTRRHYQVWYRNSADFCTTATFNLTNAIDVVWRP